MDIEKIIFVSPLNKEIKVLLKHYKLKKEFRFLSEDELRNEDLVWADALATFQTKADYDYSKLKWVHSLGAGVDNFTYQKEWSDSVMLTRTITSFGERISEYCLSYILKDLQLHQQFQSQKSIRQWKPVTPKMLKEVRVVVYGTGEIGQTLARALSVFGVKVYGVSLSGKQKEYFHKVLSIARHTEALQEADYVINTLPLTTKTEGMFNEAIFHHLSNTGFINVGRGESVHEKDLLNALECKQVRFAVLDVFQTEPLPEDHPFWQHTDIQLTPHISAVTTAKEAVECFVGTLESLEQNKPLRNKVDGTKGY
ncbi:Phosphoglycerate dehydrogenase [Gracilibacillus ureilyticus]|uniref:Phosphoglycerate dehydrogenase n=1 Tax=Gracilibacillus ureilyticus TaxID=531814 RepID=A0A1H9M7S2_9BACI|nr:D-2-hydroxyacid dehydrogenase [Gracilibacillus ureilyticus]SER19728.1 Phosphoglycerate dehydrogenase [Gracilibacillus ureilyticus]